MFHSKYKYIEWDGKRAGDFRFLQKLLELTNPVWQNKVIAKTIDGAHNGRVL